MTFELFARRACRQAGKGKNLSITHLTTFAIFDILIRLINSLQASD